MRYLLLAASILAAPAGAQVPWTAEGRLQSSDDRDASNRPYDVMPVLLSAGQRYRVIAESPGGAFDTIVQVLRPGSTEPLVENDDGGQGLNSRVGFTPEASGVYLIKVLAYSAEGRGAYVARVEAMPPLPPPISAAPTATQTSRWRIWDGALDAADPDKDGRHYDDYLIHLDAGAHLIALDATGSEPFDTLVQVLRPADREGEPIDSDDDGGPGVNSMLAFSAEQAGDYIVRVTAFTETGAGAYRLKVSD